MIVYAICAGAGLYALYVAAICTRAIYRRSHLRTPFPSDSMQRERAIRRALRRGATHITIQPTGSHERERTTAHQSIR